MDATLRTLLTRPAVEAAPLLLGMTFSTTIAGEVTAVRLTEVEAYMGADDPASHAYRGMTPRTEPMFSDAGTLYVYLSYGIHRCVNIVTGPEGVAQAVLLRGGVPTEGVELMATRRGRGIDLANGPGKLGQALGLGLEHSGRRIDGRTVALQPGLPPAGIHTTPRIGISKATDRLWRFVADDAASDERR